MAGHFKARNGSRLTDTSRSYERPSFLIWADFIVYALFLFPPLTRSRPPFSFVILSVLFVPLYWLKPIKRYVQGKLITLGWPSRIVPIILRWWEINTNIAEIRTQWRIRRRRQPKNLPTTNCQYEFFSFFVPQRHYFTTVFGFENTILKGFFFIIILQL